MIQQATILILMIGNRNKHIHTNTKNVSTNEMDLSVMKR